MADLDPKVSLLRQKLALLIGDKYCPIYKTVREQHPNALEEPWSATMNEPYKYIIFNNKTFTMFQVPTHGEAFGRTLQPDPIDCGENIKLYLDDQLFRERKKTLTMDWRTLERTENILSRAFKSHWYLRLMAWVDNIKNPLEEMSEDGKDDKEQAVESCVDMGVQ